MAAERSRRRTGPRPANERLRRLLVMLPWLMERGEVPVAEMAARFDLTEDQLVRDLELVAMCGLPPFVDEMIDVFVDDGLVFTGVPRVFTRPLRLTAPEGFALVAACRGALQLPGADPTGALARALDTLAATLGEPPVAVELDAPADASVLQDAAREGSVVRLRYWSAVNDAVTDRRVVPRAVFAHRGHWYVQADDLDIDAERSFRIDRIEDLEVTDEHVAVRDAQPPVEWFADPDDARTARLILGPDAAWVAEQYPVRDVEERPDGTLAVTLPVAGEQWLARLLVRLGDAATVEQPEEWSGIGADLARRVLAIYEASNDRS